MTQRTLSAFVRKGTRLVPGLPHGWQMKAHLMAAASRVPGGRAAYRRYQDLRATRMSDADEMLRRSIEVLDLWRSQGGNPRGRDCLEIGTGWCPWLPLLLRIQGARVRTMDLNPWLTITTATLTTRAMRERAGQIASALQIEESEIAARLEPAIQARSLAEWLQVTGIDYSAGRELNAIDYPSATFAGVFSSNVLEHVTPAALAAIHRETLRLLSDDGVAVHRINPEDHFKEVDPNITGANFLQYSSAEWHWYGGSGLAYHNRLRCCQHLRALEDAGLQIAHARTRPDPEARRAIETGALHVHPEFSGMDPVELTDDYVWVAARKQGTGA